MSGIGFQPVAVALKMTGWKPIPLIKPLEIVAAVETSPILSAVNRSPVISGFAHLFRMTKRDSDTGRCSIC